MLNYLPQFLPISLAVHNLTSRWWRTLLTVLGIVLGVAVVLAIDSTNNSTLYSIEQTFNRAVGKAELIVVPLDDAETIQEELRDWVASIPGVQQTAPMMRVRTYLPNDSPAFEARLGRNGVELGRMFEIQGIDPAVDSLVRVFDFEQGRMPQDQRYEIVLAKTYADSKGLTIGDDFAITTPFGLERFRIVGLLSDGGVATINNGQVGFVPLGVVQKTFDLGDEVSEISVQVASGVGSNPAALENLKYEIEDRLEGEAKPVYPSARGDLVPRMLNAYQTGLTFFSIIAIFVGTFLIYNTFSMTVVERTKEIGMLRAIGMRRRQILNLILVEAVILAFIGGGLGLPTGIFLARGLLVTLGGFLAAQTTTLTVEWASIFKSLGIGIGATLLAALIPAFQAASISPLEALRVRSRTAEKIHPVVWLAGLEMLALGWAGIYLIPWKSSILIPAGSTSFVFFMMGAVLVLPLLLLGFLERGSRLFASLLFGNEGRLGSSNVRRSVLRTTLTVACLMIALVMIIGIGSLSDTFKQDVQRWVNSAMGGDLFIVASDTLPVSFPNQLAAVSGIEAISPSRYLTVHIAPGSLPNPGDSKDTLIYTAIDPDKYRQVGDIIFTSGQGSAAQHWSALQEGDTVFVSSVVSEQYDLHPGDTLRLLTRRGEHDFKIAAIITDFLGQGQVITGTYSDLKRWFGEDGADRLTLTLAPGASAARVSQEIKDRFQERHHVEVLTVETIKSSVVDMLDQSFMLFDVLSWIGVVIGALGVINTMTMNVLERRREIGGLRALGMKRSQVVRMVLAEAISLGVMGCIYGLLFGYVISNIFVFTLSSISGYEVTYRFSVQPYLVSILIAILVSQIASLAPARQAAKTNIIQAIQHE